MEVIGIIGVWVSAFVTLKEGPGLVASRRGRWQSSLDASRGFVEFLWVL